MAIREGTPGSVERESSDGVGNDVRVVRAHASGRSPEHVAAELLDRLRAGGLPSAESGLALVFASVDLCTPRAFDVLHDGLRRVPVVGCSTFGQILDGDEHESGMTAALLSGEQVRFRAFSAYDVETDPDGHADDLADAIAQGCDAPVAAIVLADGFGRGAAAFVRRLGLLLPSRTKLAGAMACGDPAVGRSYQIHNERMMTRGAAVVVLDGRIAAASETARGLIALGRTSTVTEAAGTTLRAIDDAPAVDLYRRYLGDRIERLPAIGRLHPLGLGSPGEAPRACAVRAVDWQTGALELFGPVEEGQEVRVMLAQRETLLREAARAGECVAARLGGAAAFSLVFPQEARRAVFPAGHRGESARLIEAIAPVHGAIGFHCAVPLGKEGALGSAVSVLAI
jgi:hypothetical protein